MKVDVEPRERHVVLLRSHGNEGKIATELQHMDERRMIPGIHFMKGHMLASMLNVRYIQETSDSVEIMSAVPDIYGDPQQVEAALNKSFIRYKKALVVFDMHEHDGASSFFSVGRKTTVPAIAGARMLGKNTCLVQDLQFFRDHPYGVAIENGLEGADPHAIAEQMYNGFTQIANTRLRDIPLNQAIKGVRFYQKIDIFSADSNGHAAPYLDDLEAIVPSVPPHTPFDLDSELISALSLPADAEIRYDTWGHNTMARDASKTIGFTNTGVPRKECFGSILLYVDPPKEKDGYVVFEI